MEPRRHPQNLQGLLRFALEYTQSEDAPNRSAFEEMDPDRKQFLEEALKSMTLDVMKEFEKAIGVLTSTTSSTSETLESLETIREYIDNFDLANNFVKVGGSTVVVDKLKTTDNKVRTCAAYIIAEMSQNNPFCQNHFVEQEIIPVLISYLNEGEDVASSSMHAISALVRQYEPGCIAFLEVGGLECILGCLQSEHSKLFIKSCFLISTLATEYPLVGEEFIKLGAIEKLCQSIEAVNGFDIRIESLLSALDVLAQHDLGKTNLSNTNIAPCLQTLIDANQSKAECEEMVEYSKNLLKCFGTSSASFADR